MKKPLLLIIIVMALVTLACSINVDLPAVENTGPTKTLEIDEPLPENTDNVMSVYLEMGAGELNLSSGAKHLVEGDIRYNVQNWKPEVSIDDSNLRITQKTASNLSISNDIINEWKIKFNEDLIMDMEIHAGAYKGEMDLGGLQLRNLTIADGASDSKVTFDSLNPQEMERFRYSTGASKVELTGLANANFDVMTFESGAGDYSLDFSGNLQHDATVRIHSGVSQVTLKIPEGVQAEVVTSGGLNNIQMDGTWDSEGSTYKTSGEGPLLHIEIDMGVGNLHLIQG